MAEITASAAKVALEAAIAAQDGLADALVQIGLPADEVRQKKRVYLVGTEELRRDRAAQPRIFRETYLLPILIEVEDKGGASLRPTVEARAWEIVNEIIAAVDEDPELGGTVAEAALEEVPSEFSLPTANGWITKITAKVRVTAFV